MMLPKQRLSLALVLALGLASWLPALAQQHRATRLGHPATRFDAPLTRPEQLRTLLTSERMKADIQSILKQAEWPGDVEDLRRAAATATIHEWKIAPGTRMPFMSSRKDGQPVTLMDVLWAGEEPVEAYAFEFVSRGRRWRCITPKACSNFFVEELGSVVAAPALPALTLTKTAPAEAVLCAPFEVVLAVVNSGSQPLTGVRVTDSLAAGLSTLDGQSRLELEAGALAPGQGREFRFKVLPTAAGPYENRAEAVAAEGARAEAATRTVVLAPELSLTCQAPEEVRIGRPVEVCLALRNTGTTSESEAALELPIPDGASFVSATGEGVAENGRVVWPPLPLAPDASRNVCATFNVPAVATLEFAPAARGACAAPAASRCTTRMAGIPAILIEAVDLEDPVKVGAEVTYEIRVTNQGSAPATAVVLVGELPESQEFIAGSGATAVSAEGRVVRTEALPVLDAKAQAVWRVTVRAVAQGDARFKVDLSSDQFVTPIEEIEATTQY